MKYDKTIIKNACPVCKQNITEIICQSDATNEAGDKLFRIIDRLCHHCGYHEEEDYCQGRLVKSLAQIKSRKI